MSGVGIGRALILALGTVVLTTGLACGKSRERAMVAQGNAMMDVAPASPEEGPRAAEPSGGGAPVATTPQKLIRTGSIQLEVKDFDAAAASMGQLARSLGGYVADTQVTRHPSGYRSGQIILKIPAERFDSAGTSIRSQGKVLAEQSSIEDVTKAYTDLETRLKVKREALARIRELLKTRAGNLKDVLEAEREISRITEEIELAEGERQFYDHQIRLSTFTVQLQEPEPVNLARPGAWSSLGEVFRNASTMVAESLAVLLSVLLVLIPWAAAGYGIYRWVRWIIRRRRARLQAAPTSQPDKPKE